MRLFLDSNIMTYLALFEGYLCEGTRTELDRATEDWHRTIGQGPDSHLLYEVEALRILYLIEEQSHFDWLFSEVGMDEIRSIRSEARKSSHYDLLDRLIEHRRDVYLKKVGIYACKTALNSFLAYSQAFQRR